MDMVHVDLDDDVHANDDDDDGGDATDIGGRFKIHSGEIHSEIILHLT